MKQEILFKLGVGHPWADSVQYYPVIHSTNDEAKILAEANAPQGTVLIADKQLGGRGRMGNSFFSPEDAGIYMSVILRPSCHVTELMHLTCAVAVAMCDAMEAATGYRPSVKWINDLVARGKKLGGILTELSTSPSGQIRYAVVGIGINCNQTEADFPDELRPIATSLQMITGKPVDRSLLAAKMIQFLENLSQNLLAEKSAILDVYRHDCITIGQDVRVIQQSRERFGKAIDLLDDGSLQVRFLDGSVEAVQSGLVHVRTLQGYC